MRAVVCRELGPPEGLIIGDLPSEPVGPEDVRVRVRAASINFPDTLIIQGKYQVKPPLPFAPGFEVAGDVIEVGENVTRFRVGDRIMGLTRLGYGGFAEETVTDAKLAAPMPAGMDHTTATAFYTSYGTGYHALVQRGRLQAGETLLVLGASGAVGLAAIEIGKALGARVLAAASSAEKLEIARQHGADDLIDYSGDELKQRLRELTGDDGVHVCLDAVGGDAFDAVSRVMSYDGRLLVVGFASGRIPKLATNLTLLKGYAVVGVWWTPFILREPERNAANFEHLTELFAKGVLRPEVFRTYPLEGAVAALNDVLSRRVMGKLVLTIP
jgi:NADPH:quinone reductase